jgi:hypothetical protein
MCEVRAAHHDDASSPPRADRTPQRAPCGDDDGSTATLASPCEAVLPFTALRAAPRFDDDEGALRICPRLHSLMASTPSRYRARSRRRHRLRVDRGPKRRRAERRLHRAAFSTWAVHRNE